MSSLETIVTQILTEKAAHFKHKFWEDAEKFFVFQPMYCQYEHHYIIYNLNIQESPTSMFVFWVELGAWSVGVASTCRHPGVMTSLYSSFSSLGEKKVVT